MYQPVQYKWKEICGVYESNLQVTKSKEISRGQQSVFDIRKKIYNYFM